MELEIQAADVDPVPEQGPSLPLYVGQESIVPLNPAQVEGSLHPVVPVQTQVLFHIVHTLLLVAIILAAHVFAIQGVVAIAPAILLH